MALHNLSCGYWWDYCNVLDIEKEKAKEELQSATENAEVINDGDFQATMKRIEEKNRMIIPNLKNALKSFERIDIMKENNVLIISKFSTGMIQ